MPPEITLEKGEVRYIFACKKYVFSFLLSNSLTLNLLLTSNFRHPAVTIKRVRHDDSTSNLARHVKSCVPANTKEAQQMKIYAQGSTYTEADHRVKVALWISRRHRPFVIVEDPELIDIFKSLNSTCVTPKRNTVSRDVREIHEISKDSVIKFLAVSPRMFLRAHCLILYIVNSR